MAKISARSEEVRSTSEFNYHPTSFDEECQKIQYEADLGRSGTASDSERSLRGLIREDTHILEQKNKDADYELIDHLMESHKAARNTSSRAYDSCLCDSTSSFHKRPPNEVANAASAGARFESKLFSNALEVLNSDKGLFVVDFLSEPHCLPQNCIKNLQSCQKSNKTVTLKARLQKRQNARTFVCHCSSEQPGDGSRMTGSLTSLSVREIKRKLKHTFGSSRRKEADQIPKFRLPHSRSIFGHNCIYSGVETRNPSSPNTNAKAKEKVGKKQSFKVEREPLAAAEAETARKKIDVSRDVVLEATISLQNPWRVMSSLEMESCFSPRRESQYFSGSAQASIYLTPMRTRKDTAPYDGTTGSVRAETSSSLAPASHEEAQKARITPSQNIKFHDTPNAVETDDVHHSERAAKIKLMHSIMDSVSENETLSNAAYDFPSSPTLDMCDNNKYQEEYQSPVSVLDQFFAEDSSSPPHTTFQSAHEPLKQRRLHFEEPNSASSSQDTPTESDHDQDYTITNYVHLILEASSLNWDQLSAMRLPPEHLLHPPLFDQAPFLQLDPHFDTRLLFDHVGEVLIKTQCSHFVSPYWPAFAKPRMCCLPLEEAIVDEIMRDAEFYLRPQTQRTLDQLVEKDLSGPQLRPDIQPETEQIILHISEYILEESVLDVILELRS